MKFKLLLPLFAIVLFNCSEKNEASLDSETASEQLNSITDQLSDDIISMVQSQGVEGALSLVELIDESEEFGRYASIQADPTNNLVTQQIDLFHQYFSRGVHKLLEEESSGFTEIVGVYEWDFVEEDFVKNLDEESDFLVIRFPLEGATENNGEFRLTAFEVVEIDGEELPTVIKADLSVNNEKFIDLDLEINYSSEGIPEKGEISLDVLPFSFELDFDDTNSNSSSVNASLLLEGENILGLGVFVEFDSDEKIEPEIIEGEVYYRDLKIIGRVDIIALDNSEDGDPNDYIDIDIFLNESPAGEVIFELEEIEDDGETYDEYVPYVLYSDGTTESLEEMLEEALEEIEDLFE